MKLLLIISSLFLLVSCGTNYRYDVTYESCTNDIDSHSYYIQTGSGFIVLAQSVCNLRVSTRHEIQ